MIVRIRSHSFNPNSCQYCDICAQTLSILPLPPAHSSPGLVQFVVVVKSAANRITAGSSLGRAKLPDFEPCVSLFFRDAGISAFIQSKAAILLEENLMSLLISNAVSKASRHTLDCCFPETLHESKACA